MFLDAHIEYFWGNFPIFVSDLTRYRAILAGWPSFQTKGLISSFPVSKPISTKIFQYINGVQFPKILFAEQLRNSSTPEPERTAGRSEARFGQESTLSCVCRFNGEHYGNSLRRSSGEIVRNS